MPRFVRLLLIALSAITLLGGCATGYMLESKVQAFTTPGLTVTPPAGYRFERLPSQRYDPSQQGLEEMAEPVLRKAGLLLDPMDPRYSVQVSAGVQRVLSPWVDPWEPWGWGFGMGGSGWANYRQIPRIETTWFQREVRVVVRELATYRVVFEGHAANDGPWFDNISVLPAMFEAALQGFPNPPEGRRRVEILVGR